MSVLKIVSQRLSSKKNTKRIYIESGKLERAGLKAGTPIKIETSHHKVIITVSEEGNRIITSRKSRPIVDICNKEITEALQGVERITLKITSRGIIVEPLKEELLVKKSTKGLKSTTPKYMDIFAGGGTLSKCFKDAGFDPVCAIELEEKYLANYEANFPNALTYGGSIEHIDLSLLPDADIISAGIPCEGYSQSGLSGRGKNGTNREAHPTGHLGFFVLQIIGVIRPAVVLIEEVPNFKNSAMATLTFSVLKSMGYSIEETMLHAHDYGSITKRKRYCMVASLGDVEFTFPTPVASLFRDNIEDILEISTKDREWLTEQNSSTIVSMKKQEAKHRLKGNGFRIAGVESHEECCATITKGYQNRRLTDPVLTDGNGGYSFFTPRELARINGLPNDFIIPDIKSTSSQIIGQGVAYQPFMAVANQIKKICFTSMQ